MSDEGKGGWRPNMAVLCAIIAAGLIVAVLLMWTARKAEQVDEHVEARQSAAAKP